MVRGRARLAGLILALAAPLAAQGQGEAGTAIPDDPYALYLRVVEERQAGAHAAALSLADRGWAQLDADDPYRPYFALARADLAVLLSRYDEAHAALDALPALFEPFAPLRASALRVRAEAFLGAGEVARATEPIAKLSELSEVARARGSEGLVEVHAARLLAVKLRLARSDPAGAEAEILGFLEDAESYAEHADQRGVMLANLGLARAQLELDDSARPRAAADTLGEALALPLSGDLRATVAAWRAGLLVDEGRSGEAAELLEGLAPASERSRMLVATERARLHLAAGADVERLAADRTELRALLGELLAAWDALPVRPDGLGFLQYRERRALLAALLELHVAVDGEQRGPQLAAEDLLRAQARATLARRIDAPEVTLEEVRTHLLGPRHGLLLYLPVARRSHLLAIDGENVVHVSLEGVHSLDRARSAHLATLLEGATAEGARRDALAREERDRAEDLGRLLVPEAIDARLSTWEAISFTGLDALGVTAIEWLVVGGRTLGLTHAVDLVPSVPWAVARARVSPPPRAFDRSLPELLLVADTEPGPGAVARFSHLSPAVLSGRQRGALLDPYPERAARALLGPDATRASLAEEDLARLAVLQLVAHGVRLDERRRPAALVLSPGAEGDGLFGCAEVEALPSAPRVVVLASCRSGQAPRRPGDANSADLAGAWLALGSEVALTAQTDLLLSPAAELSARFHGHLREEGVSPAEALRRARSSLAVEEGLEGLALRYGALQVTGLGQRQVFRARPRPGPAVWPFLLAGTAVLAALGLAAARSMRRRA